MITWSAIVFQGGPSFFCCQDWQYVPNTLGADRGANSPQSVNQMLHPLHMDVKPSPGFLVDMRLSGVVETSSSGAHMRKDGTRKTIQTMDIELQTKITLCPCLQSIYRIHVVLIYQKLLHLGVRTPLAEFPFHTRRYWSIVSQEDCRAFAAGTPKA